MNKNKSRIESFVSRVPPKWRIALHLFMISASGFLLGAWYAAGGLRIFTGFFAWTFLCILGLSVFNLVREVKKYGLHT